MNKLLIRYTVKITKITVCVYTQLICHFLCRNRSNETQTIIFSHNLFAICTVGIEVICYFLCRNRSNERLKPLSFCLGTKVERKIEDKEMLKEKKVERKWIGMSSCLIFDFEG